MKGRMLCLSIVTVLFTLGVTAQTIGTRLAADVPFAFTAGDVKLPAGEYQIDSLTPSVVRLTSPDRKVSAMFLVNAADRGYNDHAGKLMFRKYGDRCFLASIWAPGANSGVALRQSPVERELIASANKAETQVIAARRQ